MHHCFCRHAITDEYHIIGSTQETNIVHTLHNIHCTPYIVHHIHTPPYTHTIHCTPYYIHIHIHAYIVHRPRVTACTHIHTHSVSCSLKAFHCGRQIGLYVGPYLNDYYTVCTVYIYIYIILEPDGCTLYMYGASIMLYMEIYMRLFEGKSDFWALDTLEFT